MKKISEIVNRRNRVIFLFIFCLMFFFVIMWLSPLSSDDLEHVFYHQDANFYDALMYSLQYGNGRILGNMGAVLMCQSRLWRAVIKSVVITSLIFLIPLSINKFSFRNVLAAFLLITGMSGSMFAQVFTWTSGFQNYVPPVVMTLLCICLINKMDRHPKHNLFIYLGLIIFGIAGQLFLEISTLVNLFIVFYYLKTKKESKNACIVWMISTFIGAVIMYIIPRIFYVANNRTGDYRTIHLGGLRQLLVTSIVHLGELFKFFYCNILIVIAISICALIALDRVKEKLSLSVYSHLRFSVYITMLYEAANYFVSNSNWFGRLATIRNLCSGIVTLIPCLIMLVCVLKENDKPFVKRFIALSVLVIISLAPFLIVSPISIRCVFLAYVFVVMGVIYYIDEKLVISQSNRIITSNVMCCSVVMLSLCILLTFININWLEKTRNRYIDQCMEQHSDEIVIYTIPYDYVFWDGPVTYMYCYYYEKPGDIQFAAIPYEDWSYLYGNDFSSN